MIDPVKYNSIYDGIGKDIDLIDERVKKLDAKMSWDPEASLAIAELLKAKAKLLIAYEQRMEC